MAEMIQSDNFAEIVTMIKLYLTDQEATEILSNLDESKIKLILTSWAKQAYRYYTLAESEVDPLGKKFYTSYAMALRNCINEIVNINSPNKLLKTYAEMKVD